MPESNTPIKEPKISIDRAHQSYAIFDGFDIVRDFWHYQEEAVAIAEAKNWLKGRTTVEPEIVYPWVKSFRATS